MKRGAETNARSGSGERRALVLVVDDASDDRELFLDVLDSSEIEAIAASNGEDALRIARERVPDVILLDISLPGFDGLEVTRRLQADARTVGIAIVIVTAHAEPRLREMARVLGAAAYLVKPVLPDDLLESVLAALDAKRRAT